MILYHVTKSRNSFEAILASQTLLPGRNISDVTNTWVHLSTTPFYQGSWALDIIGADTNEAWIFTIEIDDDSELLPDPTGEGEIYNGPWVVCTGPLTINIRSVHYIKNVQKWENGHINAIALPL